MWRKQSWRWAMVGVGAVALGAATWTVNAADEMTGGEMPSMEQMMEQYAALAKPGPQHKQLATLEGEFKAECISYMDPAGPQTSKGEVENEMILGGRFLQTEFEGEMAGTKFEGLALTGYDNVKRQYISFWTDTMSTNWMTSAGEADASGKVVTLLGSYDDPVMNMTVESRQVLTFLDKNHYKVEMYGPGPDGADMKMMEITYTRD